MADNPLQRAIAALQAVPAVVIDEATIVERLLDKLSEKGDINITQQASHAEWINQVALQINTAIAYEGLPPEAREALQRLLTHFETLEQVFADVPKKQGDYPLVGRDALLAELKMRLRADGQPRIALQGLPGVGKTSLAMALAYDAELRAHFSGGVLWAGLGQEPALLTELWSWGKALGLTEEELSGSTDLESCTQLVKNTIGARKMLLIIDDAWDIDDVAALALGGPNCAHLMTTRRKEIAAAFAVQQFIIPELEAKAGLELLAGLAPSVVADEPQETEALVGLVGGLPLALTLMGNYLRKKAVLGQSRLVRQALGLLGQAKERLALGDKISLETVIKFSDDALDPAARQALRMLSVFPPKPNIIPEAAALAVCAPLDEAIEVVYRLLESGLLEAAGDGLFTLHQVIHDYARHQQQQDGDPQASARLAAYYAGFVTEDVEDFDTLGAQMSNILAAARAAHCLDDTATLITIMHTLAVEGYMDYRGHTSAFLRELDLAIKAARAAGDRQQAALHYMLGKRGNAFNHRGDFPDAIKCYAEAAELAHALQSHWADRYVLALCATGGMRSENKDYAAAEADLELAHQIAVESGKDELVIVALEHRALCADRQEKYETSRQFSKQAFELAEQIGDVTGQFFGLMNWGAAECELDNFGECRMLFEQALAIARTEAVEQWLAYAQDGLAETFYQMGEYAQALTHLEAAFAIYSNRGLTAKAQQLEALRTTIQQRIAASSAGVEIKEEADHEP